MVNFKNYSKNTPNAEHMLDDVLFIPLHYYLSDKEVLKIAYWVNFFFLYQEAPQIEQSFESSY